MRARWLDVVDIAIYLMVLNLAVALFPSVISEGFWLTVLTAVLLKAVLELVVLGKNTVKRRVRAASSVFGKTVNALLLFAVMAGSKFLVIELTALLFGDAVKLGSFWSVTALILVLMLTRYGIRWIVRAITANPNHRPRTQTPA